MIAGRGGTKRSVKMRARGRYHILEGAIGFDSIIVGDSNRGRVVPFSGGLLKASDSENDLVIGCVVGH